MAYFVHSVASFNRKSKPSVSFSRAQYQKNSFTVERSEYLLSDTCLVLALLIPK